MRGYLLIVFLLTSTWIFSQEKECDFSFDSAKVLNDSNLATLISSLQESVLIAANDKKRIPLFIKHTLDCWTGKFDIANPNERFQAGDVILSRIKPFHRRQLIYLGLSDQHILMAYKKGGRGISYHLLIFKLEGKKIIDFWGGYGGNLTTKEEILYYLNHKEKSQTNVIYF